MEIGRNQLHMNSPNSILIRRVLCPSSAESSLPALTSSPNVDSELYVLISLILRDFVKKWYNDITYDDDFIAEIVGIIAHITRALEERIRKIDLEAFFLDDIPRILNIHLVGIWKQIIRMLINADYRTALARFKYYNLGLEEYFHHLQPHVALESTVSDIYYRTALSEGILALLLPCEDFRSDCERLILREILANIILGEALQRLSEPWMIWEIIIKILKTEQPRTRSIWVFPYSHLMPSIPTLLSMLQNTVLVVYSLVAPVNKPSAVPFSKSHLTTLISTLFTLQETGSWLLSQFRLAGSLIMESGIGHMVDKYTLFKFVMTFSAFSRLLRQHVFCEKTIVLSLREIRYALFPNNILSPPRQKPSPTEEIALRQEATETIISALPSLVAQQLFGETPSMQHETVKEILDCFSNKQINRHLVYALLDELVRRLVPEFLTDTIEDIVNIRLG